MGKGTLTSCLVDHQLLPLGGISGCGTYVISHFYASLSPVVKWIILSDLPGNSGYKYLCDCTAEYVIEMQSDYFCYIDFTIKAKFEALLGGLLILGVFCHVNA